MKNKALSLVITICMIMTLWPGAAFAGTVDAPQPPANPKITVGEIFQTMPTLTWDKKDYSCSYGIDYTNHSSGTSNNYSVLWDASDEEVYRANTDASWSSQINNMELRTETDLGTSTAVMIPYEINFKSIKKEAVDVTEFIKDNTALYTIKGLPADCTAYYAYTNYISGSDDYAAADNLGAAQPFEINEDGVLVIHDRTDEESPKGYYHVGDNTCYRYLVVFTDSIINHEDKTVSVNQEIYPLNNPTKPTYDNSQTLSIDPSYFDEGDKVLIAQGKSKKVIATNSAGADGGSILYHSDHPSVHVHPTTGVVTAIGEIGDRARVEVLVGSTEKPDGTGHYAPNISTYDVKITEDIIICPAPSDIKFEMKSNSERYATLPVLSRKQLNYNDYEGYSISYLTRYEEGGESEGVMNYDTLNYVGNLTDSKVGDKWTETITKYILINNLREQEGEKEIRSEEVIFDCNVTINNEHLEDLTATYTKATENIDGSDREVYTYTVPDLSSGKSVYINTTKYNANLFSSGDGTLVFKDYVRDYEPEGKGYFGLATDQRDADLGVYVTVFTNPVISGATVSFTQERHKLNFVQDDGLTGQTISWSGGGEGLSTNYGTPIEGKTATNSSDNGGSITYSSSDTSVAAVDSSTGSLTIVGAGEAKIKATAAKVEGTYKETSITYPLTVHKKNITVQAEDKTKTFGEANPELTFTVSADSLVGSDAEKDLGVALSTTATATSNVGDYPITGTSATSRNYNVVVNPAVLSISKAAAPTLADTTKNLLYSTPYTDIEAVITGLPEDCGTVSFAAGTPEGTTAILNSEVQNTMNGIKFSTTTGAIGNTVTIPVTVTMQNYGDASTNVVVKLVDKTPVTITGVTVASKNYDGNAISATGTPSGTYGDVSSPTVYTGNDFQYIWMSGASTLASAPKDAGDYTLTVKIPDSNGEYMGQLGPMNFTISKASLTVKPANLRIYNGTALPTPTAIDYIGLKGSDTKDVVSGDDSMPAMKIYQTDGTTELTSSAINGTYPIKFISTVPSLTADNYDITVTDGTLTISTKSSGGSSGGGGNGGGTTTPTKGTEKEVKTSVTPTVENGTANASVGDKAVTEALEKTAEGATVEFNVPNTRNTDAVSVALTNKSVKALANSKTGIVTVSSELGSMDISDKTLESIAKQAGSSDITINLGKVDKEKELNEKQKDAIGDAPVYDISIKAGSSYISSFDGGLITLNLPYELKDGENPSGIVVWYVDDYGNIKKVTTMYDTKTKSVIFTTNHLSLYAIGYDETQVWVNPFADVANTAWYFEAVKYVNTNNLMSGVAADKFNPKGDTTRAMVVTILYRLAGEPAADTSSNTFSDISSGIWYEKAVSWAAENGIVKGYDNGKFGPMDSITREQMTLILMSYAKLKNINTTGSKEISSFADSASVSTWALDSMKWAYNEGLISGKGNNKLDSRGKASRAETATILMRFIEE
ncbi:S-layer homology domain-containing protein [Anaerovorax sp. IOR16]|uniref:S-layer homology domain-containing protein n=1 Tax=Anaerovorax sp. IOR16 TaxID=2773458 RepID=UPI0019CF8347|nr:S-layer homology domain-containing protein [Anaerovorax sp. IOR16]